MNAEDLKPGTKVKYNHSNGSIGSIGEVKDCVHVGRYLVVWVYGLNNFGEVMKANSFCYPEELIPATEEEYQARANRKGFGG